MGVTITGLDKVIANAKARAERARNMVPALKVIGQVWLLAVDDRFRTGTNFAGEKWAPDAPATVAAKGSSKVGVDKEILRSSNGVTIIGNDTVRVGTNVPYATPFAFGAQRHGTLKHRSGERAAGTAFRVVQPARSFLPVERDGRWIDRGPAAVLLQKAARIALTFVLTGRLS